MALTVKLELTHTFSHPLCIRPAITGPYLNHPILPPLWSCLQTVRPSWLAMQENLQYPQRRRSPRLEKLAVGFRSLKPGLSGANWLVTVNCRRQKMKCRIDSGNICRRCRRSGNPCIFVPRSNASVPFMPGSLPLTDPTHIEFNSEILRRLQSIEEYIGLSRSKPNEAETAYEIDLNGEDELLEEDSSLTSLWEAVRCLERISPSSIDASIWRRSTIKHLWQMYVTLSRAHFLSANTTLASMKRRRDSTFFQANNGFLPLGHCFWLPFYTAQALVELLK